LRAEADSRKGQGGLKGKNVALGGRESNCGFNSENEERLNGMGDRVGRSPEKS